MNSGANDQVTKCIRPGDQVNAQLWIDPATSTLHF